MTDSVEMGVHRKTTVSKSKLMTSENVQTTPTDVVCGSLRRELLSVCQAEIQRDCNIKLLGTVLSFKTSQNQSSSSQGVFLLSYWVNDWNWQKFLEAVSQSDEFSYTLSELVSSINTVSACLSLCLIAHPAPPHTPTCLPTACGLKFKVFSFFPCLCELLVCYMMQKLKPRFYILPMKWRLLRTHQSTCYKHTNIFSWQR